MLGNIYIFEGWLGVVLFAVILTLVMGALLRRDNAWALAAVGLVYWYAVSFNAGYPDVIPKTLQALLSMAVAYALVRVMSRPALDPSAVS